MGNVCCSEKKEKKKIALLLVGLDNAGKTVAAKGLAGEPIDDVLPTLGFHTVKLSYNDFIVKVYDLGGAASFRAIWPKYFVDVYGIIFVIDSSDFERVDEAKQVLMSVLSHEKISGKPLLFLANKQDDENALDEIDLHEKLNLEYIVNTYHCPTLVECSGATNSKKKSKVDTGIKKGFMWLMNYIDRNYEDLNIRVVNDSREQKEKEKKLREEIIKRVQEAKHVQEVEDEDAIELYSEYTKKISESKNNISNGNCIKSTKTNSENSLDTFPHLYHGPAKTETTEERPKSARELVRDHLYLNCNGMSSTKSNKTMPIRFFGSKSSNSAKERSRISSKPRRTLRSAGDAKMNTNSPNSVFPMQQKMDIVESIDFRDFNKTCLFLPVDLSPKIKISNGMSWTWSEDMEISCIDIT